MAVFWLTAVLLLSGYAGFPKQPWVGEQRHLQGAYSVYAPYSFYEDEGGRLVVRGLDVEIAQKSLLRMGYASDMQMMVWSEQLQALEAGDLDFMLAAFKTPEREQFAHFSDSYRDQMDQLYVRTNFRWDSRIQTWEDLFQAMEAQTFKLGVIQGSAYASLRLQAYLKTRPDLFVVMGSEQQLMVALAEGKLDGVVIDRLAGSSFIAKMDFGRDLVEAPLETVTRPVHLMFSKKTVSAQEVAAINQALRTLEEDGELPRIKRHYVLPVFAHITTDSVWFYSIELLAIVALAIPGLIIARSQGYDVYGAWLLAAMPGLGGGILRDLLIHRHPVFLFQRPGYMLSVFAIWALFGILSALSPGFYRASLTGFSRPYFLGGSPWALGALLITAFDALGYAAFTVVGVVVAVQAGAEPLWLWGPALAALTVSGGGILRDMLHKPAQITHLKGGLVPELSVIWACLLSYFLIWETDRLRGKEIMWGIIFTLCGMFLSQLWVAWRNWKSPTY